MQADIHPFFPIFCKLKTDPESDDMILHELHNGANLE